MKTVDKKELCKILGIGKETLKDIKKACKLEIRLENIGYKLLNRYKVGRSIMYDIELVDAKKEKYVNILGKKYKSKKTNEFKTYFKTRTTNSVTDTPISKKDVANMSNVSVNTISKWDNISVNENMISEKGFYYLLIDYNTRTIQRVDYEYYCSFWKARAEDKKTDELTELFNQGLISLDELLEHVRKVSSCKQALEKRICFKLKKYELNEDNYLYKIFKDLITYESDNNFSLCENNKNLIE